MNKKDISWFPELFEHPYFTENQRDDDLCERVTKDPVKYEEHGAINRGQEAKAHFKVRLLTSGLDSSSINFLC